MFSGMKRDVIANEQQYISRTQTEKKKTYFNVNKTRTFV